MVTGSRSIFINLGQTRQMREKRMSVRIAVEACVRISHSTFGVIHTVTRDVSDTGVFLRLEEKPNLPVGAHIKMHMLDSAYPEIAFNMKVVRTSEHGISLTFVDYELNGQRYPMTALKRSNKPKSRAV
jgi:hypothetical protein